MPPVPGRVRQRTQGGASRQEGPRAGNRAPRAKGALRPQGWGETGVFVGRGGTALLGCKAACSDWPVPRILFSSYRCRGEALALRQEVEMRGCRPRRGKMTMLAGGWRYITFFFYVLEESATALGLQLQ